MIQSIKITFGLAMLLVTVSSSANDLGISEDQLNQLLNIQPAKVVQKTTKQPKAVTVRKPSQKVDSHIQQFLNLPAAKAVTKKKKQTTKKKVAQPKMKAQTKVVKKVKPRPTTKKSHSFDCEQKYCKDMSSCKEARYKLEQCGHDQLDRDGDGIPCENVCS